ncbi:unnamed protein product [Lampetra planeri]
MHLARSHDEIATPPHSAASKRRRRRGAPEALANWAGGGSGASVEAERESAARGAGGGVGSAAVARNSMKMKHAPRALRASYAMEAPASRIGGLGGGGGGSGGVAERAAPRTEPRPSSIAGLKSSADIRGEWRQNGSWLALPQPLTARRPSPASARSETLSVTADKPLGSKPAWQPPVMKRASL